MTQEEIVAGLATFRRLPPGDIMTEGKAVYCSDEHFSNADFSEMVRAADDFAAACAARPGTRTFWPYHRPGSRRCIQDLAAGRRRI